nr:DUF2637 domain-containing protein [Nocardia bovistercoris]
MFTPARIAVAGTILIAALSFDLSFAALTDLAARSGVRHAAAWPLIVDGLIVVATVAVVALRGSAYGWFLLAVGALVSVAGNVTHAVLPPGPVSSEVAAAVALVPPVALLAVTHLTVLLARAAMTVDDQTPEPVAAESPSADPEQDMFRAVEQVHIDQATPQPSLPAAAVVPRPAAPLLPAAPSDRPAPAAPPAPQQATAAAQQTPAESTVPRRAAAEELIRTTELSNYAIAARVGASEPSVRRWRNQLATT